MYIPEASKNPAAEGHRTLRALLSKYGYSPKDPDVHPLITGLEQAYAQDLEQVCVDLSDRNNAADFKVLILANRNLEHHSSQYSSMIAVTKDKRLVTARFDTLDEMKSAIRNPMHALTSGKFNPDFDFSMREIPESGQLDTNADHDHDPNMEKLHASSLKSVTSCIKHYNHQYHLEQPVKDELYEVLKNCISRRLLVMFRMIRNALAPELLQIMKECRLTHSGHMRWLTGGDGVSRETIRARQQAVLAYPIMAKIFYSTDSFRKVIDNRTSLKTAMAQKYQVDKSGIKRLSGLNKIYPEKFVDGFRISILKILDIPDQVVPKSRADFKDLGIFAEFGAALYHENLPETMWRLSEHGNPLRLIDRIRQTSGQNVSDAVDFLARKLFVPACLYRIMFPESITMTMFQLRHFARNEILSSFSVTELLDFSERYHRNIMRYEDRLELVTVNYDWPGLFGTLEFDNGYTARELTSSRQLRLQGLVENHCVGGYASLVLDGDIDQKAVTIIFSIEKDGACLSTAEIECGPDIGNTLYGKVIQNQARSNTVPSGDAKIVAERITKHISKANPRILSQYCEGLKLARQEMNLMPGFSEEIMACGFDPYNRAHFDIVWEELRSVLPRHIRQDGPDEFIRKAEFNRDSIAVPEKLRKFRLSKNPGFDHPVRNIGNDGNYENDGNFEPGC